MKYYKDALSIPIFPDLKKKEINFVINKINEIIKI
jgi:dTDP-4-amino-4,6-dideoxygalactose transaminase